MVAVASMRSRGIRPVGSGRLAGKCRAARPDCLELGPLLVVQGVVKLLQRRLTVSTADIIASMRCCMAAIRLGAVNAAYACDLTLDNPVSMPKFPHLERGGEPNQVP